MFDGTPVRPTLAFTVLLSAVGHCARVASAIQCTLPPHLGAVGVWCGGG